MDKQEDSRREGRASDRTHSDKRENMKKRVANGVTKQKEPKKKSTKPDPPAHDSNFPEVVSPTSKHVTHQPSTKSAAGTRKSQRIATSKMRNYKVKAVNSDEATRSHGLDQHSSAGKPNKAQRRGTLPEDRYANPSPDPRRRGAISGRSGEDLATRSLWLYLARSWALVSLPSTSKPLFAHDL